MATISSLVVNLTARSSDFERSMKKMEREVMRTSRRLQDMGGKLTAGLTLPLAAAGGAALKLAVDFESAFAGVEKTVNGTTLQLEALRGGIRRMAKEIPASTTEIAKVAEAAGQLGIKTPNILAFTRVMIDLGNTTNLSAEEAATALARLANITKLPQEQFDRLGATIVALGNQMATTEAEIVQMALRLAGAGAQVGLSQAQILGFAAALSSVGIEAEAGGTAFSKVFIGMAQAVHSGGEELRRFAAVAGMSVGEFSALFKTSASAAVERFVQGLGRVSAAGKDVFRTLDDLGLGEVRVRDALLRLSGNSALLGQALSLSAKGWQENSALAAEAAKRYQTTAARLQVLGQKAADLGIQLGETLLPAMTVVMGMAERMLARIEPLVVAFAQADERTQKFVVALGLIAVAAGPALIALASILAAVSVLANPLFLAIAAWTTLGATIAARWDAIKEGWDTLWHRMQNSPAFLAAIAGIKQRLTGIASVFQSSADDDPEWDAFVAQVKAAAQKRAADLARLGSGSTGKVSSQPAMDPQAWEKYTESLRKRQESLKVIGERMRSIDNYTSRVPVPDPGPWVRFTRNVDAAFHRLPDAFRAMGVSMGATLGGLTAQLAKGEMSFRKFGDEAVRQLARMAAQAAGMAIGGPIGGFIGSFLGGMFADGGRPPLGMVSVVGEEGPELFVPDTAGTIVPFGELQGSSQGAVGRPASSGQAAETAVLQVLAEGFGRLQETAAMVLHAVQAVEKASAETVRAILASANRIVDSVSRVESAALQLSITAAAGAVAGGIAGFFADGGRPPLGGVSMVGEEGPELFVPDTAGTIVPFSELQVAGAGAGGGGNTTFQFNITGVDFGSRDAAKRLLRTAADLVRSGSPEGLTLSRLAMVRAEQNNRRAA